MRLATYNVEWFNALFDDDDRLRADDGPSGRHGISRAAQAAALGVVLRALDADAVLIVEAPDASHRRDTVAALTDFAAHFDLRTTAVALGFANTTRQELALLYDPARLSVRHDPRAAPNAPRFDGSFAVALEPGGSPQKVRFSKPPLELAALTAGGTALRLIGVHLKSRSPPGPGAARRRAIASRRIQRGQALWLRARIDAHLAAGEPLVVLGDLNDGPGTDREAPSTVAIVQGDTLHDPHARSVTLPPPASALFRPEPEGPCLQALLDYAMISPDLMRRRPVWRIWHPLDDPAIRRRPDLRSALLQASDHFPVTLDLQI